MERMWSVLVSCFSSARPCSTLSMTFCSLASDGPRTSEIASADLDACSAGDSLTDGDAAILR
jgi:hypothetical protein